MTDITDPTKPVAWTSKAEFKRMPKDAVAAVWPEKENETDIPLHGAYLLSEYERVKAERDEASADLDACQKQAVKDGNEIASLKAWQAGAISCREAEQARIDEAIARSEALEAENKRLREAFELPQDVVESLLAIGPVEWGVSLTQSDEKHASDLLDTLRLTREYFDMPVEETGIHGVYLEGTGTVLAHTGMSPNSPQHARILAGAWNQLVDMARALEASR